MCGIVGIFAYSAAAPAPRVSELEVIRDHMAARGPDGRGLWADRNGRLLLGHRRLSIIDLSDRAAQPMQDEAGRHVVSFNGEIYNFEAIRSRLQATGYRFRTTSDTEVLLALYAEKGPAMVEELRGMFAFAIWDEERQGLFLARDPYGIKPLYYADDNGVLRFASQVKALLAGGALSRDLDPAGLCGFHIFGAVPDPFTLYRSISALPAGSTLWADAEGVRPPHRYVKLSQVLAEGQGRPLGGSLEDVVREAMLDSVRSHLVADVEVGAFLSAGIDSGALVGLMRDAGQAKICTITLAFEEFRDTSQDETPLASKVAALYGAQHHTRVVSRTEFEEDLPLIINAMDQPSVDGVNTWFVSKAARELGLKVALSGVGGDELLAGYSTFRDVPKLHRWLGPAAGIPGLAPAARLGLKASGIARWNPKTTGLLSYAGTYAGAYMLRRAVLLPEELGEVLDSRTVREGLERLQLLDLITDSMTPDPGAPIARVSALESSNYMQNQLLRDTDWAAMAHSLEIRTPLVDLPLLKALAPAGQQLTGGRGKRALALAPATPLPNEVVYRPKTGFGLPTGAWMNAAGAASLSGNDRMTSRNWNRLVLQRFLLA